MSGAHYALFVEQYIYLMNILSFFKIVFGIASNFKNPIATYHVTSSLKAIFLKALEDKNNGEYY